MSPMTEFLQARGLKTQDEADDLLLRLVQDRQALLDACKSVEQHHVTLNGLAGRGEERSATLRIIRAAIAQVERVTP